jgi:peptidoglycan/LPS O-acetylase OafA/YrhL
MVEINARDPWLDVVRGVAIMAVVVTHAMQSSDAFTASRGGITNGLFTRLASNGAWGVELFFFLSGWLLSSIYQTTAQPLGKKYWYRRMSRILPLWGFFLGLEISRNYLHLKGNYYELVASHAIPQTLFFNQLFVTIISALTFTLWFSGGLWGALIPGGWSIQAEVGHYLVFPLIRNRSMNKVFIGLNVISGATLFANHLQHNKLITTQFLDLAVSAWLRLDLYATFGYFLLGVLSYKFIEQYHKEKNLLGAFRSLGVNSFNLGLYLLLWLLLPLNFAHHGEIGTLAFVIFFIWLSRIFLKINFLRRIFKILGRFSYFIYFFHFLALELTSMLLKNFTFSLNFIGSFVVAFILYLFSVLSLSCIFALPSEKFIEKPFMNLARRV